MGIFIIFGIPIVFVSLAIGFPLAYVMKRCRSVRWWSCTFIGAATGAWMGGSVGRPTTSDDPVDNPFRAGFSPLNRDFPGIISSPPFLRRTSWGRTRPPTTSTVTLETDRRNTQTVAHSTAWPGPGWLCDGESHRVHTGTLGSVDPLSRGSGDVPIDNNHVENRIWPVALGRSNWLFFGSLRAGQRAAAIMSLIQSAKLNGHDPYRYLKDVLERLPTQAASRLEELLPHRWAS
jgi:hypothetical protein